MNSNVNKETEVEIYCKIGNADGLNEANKIEKHIQIEGKYSKGERCRIRKIYGNGDTKYIYTIKINNKKDIGIDTENLELNDEYNTEVDENFTNGFINVADRILKKTRYTFFSENVSMQYTEDNVQKAILIPNIEYEVDMYTKKDGTICEWCKIDVELDNILNTININHSNIKDISIHIKVSHLPFKPIEAIIKSAANEEQTKLINDLLENEFVYRKL